MVELSLDRVGLYALDQHMIQDVVHYAEERFKTILHAMDKSPEKNRVWMENCLCKELVSVFFIRTVYKVNMIKKLAIHPYLYWTGYSYRKRC